MKTFKATEQNRNNLNFSQLENHENDSHNVATSKLDGCRQVVLLTKVWAYYIWFGLSLPSRGGSLSSHSLFSPISSQENTCRKDICSLHRASRLLCYGFNSLELCHSGNEGAVTSLHGKASELACAPSRIETIFQLTGPGLLSGLCSLAEHGFLVN